MRVPVLASGKSNHIESLTIHFCILVDVCNSIFSFMSFRLEGESQCVVLIFLSDYHLAATDGPSTRLHAFPPYEQDFSFSFSFSTKL